MLFIWIILSKSKNGGEDKPHQQTPTMTDQHDMNQVAI